MMGNAQHPLGVASPAKLHFAILPSSSPSGQSGTPSHSLSKNIGRVNPNLSRDKQLVTGFQGFIEPVCDSYSMKSFNHIRSKLLSHK